MRQAQDEIKTRHLKEAEIEALQQQLNVRRIRPAGSRRGLPRATR